MTHGFFTTTEAGAALGLQKATISAWADSGRIAVERAPGGHRRIPADQVKYLLAIRGGLLAQLPEEDIDADVLAAAAIWHTRYPTVDDTMWRRQFIDGYVTARRGPNACLPWVLR